MSDQLKALEETVKRLQSELQLTEFDRDWWRDQARVLADLATRNNPVAGTVATNPSDEFP